MLWYPSNTPPQLMTWSRDRWNCSLIGAASLAQLFELLLQLGDHRAVMMALITGLTV